MSTGGRRAAIFAASMGLAASAGCGTAPMVADTARSPVSTSAAVPSTNSTTTTTTTTGTTPSTQIPPFLASTTPVTAADLGATWHPGCPVDPTQLRAIHLEYWGFDGQPHPGTIVVNASVVQSIIQVFTMLYNARFPISEVVPQSAYGGDDNAAAAADDTSGFNCRVAVNSGPPSWSMHAYGEAIDVNDVQNPYVSGTTIIPPGGAGYLDRNDVRPGMATPAGTLVDVFTAIGWGWGGNWVGTLDYQHFSTNGH